MKELKKYLITEEYSDLCFFRKMTEVRGYDVEDAEERYNEGDEEFCTELTDEMFEQDNDARWSEITEIEEIK